jgi:hypothetical protein
MANAVTHTTVVRTALGDAFRTQVGATLSKLKIYDGTVPANAQASLSGNTLLSTITAITLGAGSSGVNTISASTADPSAVAAGTATFFRWTDNSNTVCLQGTVGTSGCDMNLNSTSIALAATVTLTSGTYTAPL